LKPVKKKRLNTFFSELYRNYRSKRQGFNLN